jgi:pantothenate synthetase
MVRDLRFPVEIVAGPTAREADGLARSSRNQYLTAEQRPQAVCLRRALDEAERRFAAGERDPAALVAAHARRRRPRAAAKIDYVEIVDDENPPAPRRAIARPALAPSPSGVGQPRLIDNAVLRP